MSDTVSGQRRAPDRFGARFTCPRPATLFDIAHFDGYAAVLIQLNKIGRRELREVLLEGWLACAPNALAEEFLNRA